MARVKRGVTSHARHKKVLARVKGQYGRRKTSYRVARQAMERAMQYAYRDRRTKKRDFRGLWIQRINAACRLNGMRYSELIHGLKKIDNDLNRKQLSDLAILYPQQFAALVNAVKTGS